ncbi:MAG TPA: Co2+/Mg2+ efflux protein ApaG [Polyangia bacterium]
MSRAVTKGILVTVKSAYMPDRSTPTLKRFAFAYTVTIANEGEETTQLTRRHWYITDAEGNVEEVEGEGVVGEQPVLAPGESFEYTSWCQLKTPSGTMHGTYKMVGAKGAFEAEIAPFRLGMPYSLN